MFLDLHLRGDGTESAAVWGPQALAVEGVTIASDARITWTDLPKSLESAAGSTLSFDVTVRNDRPGATDVTLRTDHVGMREPVTIAALAPGTEETVTLMLTTDSERKPADLNGDGQVNLEDLLILLSSWGPCSSEGACPADRDSNGEVTLADLLILLSFWS